MKASRKRRRWWLRLPAGLLAVLVLGVLILWLALPGLIERGGAKAARDFGFEEATLTVERADLGGFQASEVRARMGGLAVALDQAGAEYDIGGLRHGEVDAVVVKGLAVTLDFTLPRQSLLPDAVEEVLSNFGGGGELVWPITHLRLQDCALTLVLPGGRETFLISGTADKQPDGRVRFDLLSNHPQQRLHLAGAIRTETMDGEINVHEVTVQPIFLLGLAQQLGLFVPPEGLRLESSPVTLAGTAALRAGAPEKVELAVKAPRLEGGFAGAAGTMEGLEVRLSRSAEGAVRGSIGATLAAAAADGAWSLAPVKLDLTLEEARVHGSLQPLVLAFGEAAGAEAALTLDLGVPQLGGEAGGRLELEIRRASFSEYELAPVTLRAEGGLEALRVTATRLHLREKSPASILGLAATVKNLLGEERAFEVEFGVSVDEPHLNPTGAVDAPIARVTTRGTMSEDALRVSGTAETTLDEVTFGPPDRQLQCVPRLRLDWSFDGSAVEAAVDFEVSRIKTNIAGFPPGVHAASLKVEIPPVTTSALAALADGRVPAESFSARVSGSVLRSDAKGGLSLELQHQASAGWAAGARAFLDNVTGTWGAARVEGLKVEASLDTGPLPEELLRAWIGEPRLDVIVPELLTRASLGLTASASTVELPGTARLEWISASVDKPAGAAEADPAVSARFALNAGNLRAGPEVIEQPAFELNLAGAPSALAARARLAAMIEGYPLVVTADQNLAIDWPTLSVKGGGAFALEPFRLLNSDIVSRWVPSLKGVSLTGRVAGSGAVTYASTGEWDGNAAIDVTEVAVNHPAQRLKGEGIELHLAVKSLQQLNSDPGQEIRFGRLALGDISVSDGSVRFYTDSATILHVEGARTSVFGGDVTMGPFSLFFPNLDMAVVLDIERLDLAQVVRELNMFNGSMTGRLRGRLPIALLAGRPFIGEGFLELDPRFPARMVYDARGTFTKDMPNRNVIDQVNRLPYDLLEEGLANLVISTMRVEMFKRDRPDTPIRIEFAGESVTPRARVPMEIVTNVNGTVAEVINLLLRLASL